MPTFIVMTQLGYHVTTPSEELFALNHEKKAIFSNSKYPSIIFFIMSIKHHPKYGHQACWTGITVLHGLHFSLFTFSAI